MITKRTKMQLKHTAQDYIIAGAAAQALGLREAYGEIDEELIAEIERQTERVRRLFGIDSGWSGV